MLPHPPVERDDAAAFRSDFLLISGRYYLEGIPEFASPIVVGLVRTAV
jgi:hypothetical protein